PSPDGSHNGGGVLTRSFEPPIAPPCPLPPAFCLSMNDRSWLGLPARPGTCARYSNRLALASTPGFGRRRLPARYPLGMASSLDFLQGTSEKIHFQCLLRKYP